MNIIGIMPKKNDLKFITISIILLALSVGLVRSSIGLLSGGKRLKEIELEVVGLESQKGTLEKSIKYKQTNDYIEERARNDLNLVKPGEKIYVVASGSGGSDNQNSNIPNVLSSSSKKLEESMGIKSTNLYQWYKLFF